VQGRTRTSQLPVAGCQTTRVEPRVSIGNRQSAISNSPALPPTVLTLPSNRAGSSIRRGFFNSKLRVASCQLPVVSCALGAARARGTSPGLISILVAGACFLAGCTRVEVVRPDGTRVVVERVGYDTKIGALRIAKEGTQHSALSTQNSPETLRIELDDLTSEARALRIAEEAVKAIGGAK
jgi:hypothetical protein